MKYFLLLQFMTLEGSLQPARIVEVASLQQCYEMVQKFHAVDRSDKVRSYLAGCIIEYSKGDPA